MSEAMVLGRYLAQAGVASRRASVDLIKAGKVRVNGTLTNDPATRVTPGVDRVEYEGKPVNLGRKRYFLLHKPEGYTCSASDRFAEKLALELLPEIPGERLFSVGRLDRDSEGLILFTNDGELANRLTHPRYEVPKVYEVWLTCAVTEDDARRLLDGVEDEGELLRAKAVKLVNPSHLRIVVTEGKKREIRRMIRCLGARVRRLLRTEFGPLKLGPFEPGKVHELTPAELKALQTFGAKFKGRGAR